MWFGRSPNLKVFDRCAGAFSFPVLDNGYVYLAATRLSLHRGGGDWALVIEVFGFSPRAGFPDTSIYTIASALHNRNRPDQYVTRQAYENYLKANPNNEFRTVFALDEGDWQDTDDPELVSPAARHVVVRGTPVPLPSREDYAAHGITLESPDRVQVFELCRFLAATHRDLVLATPEERRVSVPPHLDQILVLDEWNHPDLSSGVLPSRSETFRQLARVLETGDVSEYQPAAPPNTHWTNWPESGRL